MSAGHFFHIGFMYFGMILAVILALREMGGFSGFKTTMDAIDAAEGTHHFSMFGVGASKVTSWIVASVLSAGAAQASIQPVLAAKNPKVAKKACLIAAAVVVPFGLFTCMLGMSARVMAEQGILAPIEDAKLAYTTLIMHFPPIIGGIILASILAAVLSTVSPIILAAATMFTKDIYQQRINPSAPDKQITRMARIGTAVSGVLCCLMAIALVNSSAVLDLVYIGSFAISETCLGVVLACVTIMLFSLIMPKKAEELT